MFAHYFTKRLFFYVFENATTSITYNAHLYSNKNSRCKLLGVNRIVYNDKNKVTQMVPPSASNDDFQFLCISQKTNFKFDPIKHIEA